MRGYPKILNTKDDYEYVRDNFPKSQWQADWQNLLDTMRDWVPLWTLKSRESGIEDETHKITSETRDNEYGEYPETVYTQWEYQVIPTCKLLILGFSEEEVTAALHDEDDTLKDQ